MNEASLAITPGFFDLAKTLGEAIVEVADDLGSETPIGIAAE
jgi:hypothetical protein